MPHMAFSGMCGKGYWTKYVSSRAYFYPIFYPAVDKCRLAGRGRLPKYIYIWPPEGATRIHCSAHTTDQTGTTGTGIQTTWGSSVNSRNTSMGSSLSRKDNTVCCPHHSPTPKSILPCITATQYLQIGKNTMPRRARSELFPPIFLNFSSNFPELRSHSLLHNPFKLHIFSVQLSSQPLLQLLPTLDDDRFIHTSEQG